MRNEILQGDVIEQLKRLASGSVNCVVTSPPYFGQRDYQTAQWVNLQPGPNDCDHSEHLDKPDRSVLGICAKCGAVRKDQQIGLEDTPAAYVANMVKIFREVRRVLRDDGVCWIVLGDSYATGTKAGRPAYSPNGTVGANMPEAQNSVPRIGTPEGLKTKDLIGIPWMVAFALRDGGWYLRSDIIWHKSNSMPESCKDRPTKSHEYIFLLTKKERYWYDADAIREPLTTSLALARNGKTGYNPAGRNKRSVWKVATKPLSGKKFLPGENIDHFAAYPPKLVEPCILAGCPSRVCVECGTPWVRVIEKSEPYRIGGNSGNSQSSATGPMDRNGKGQWDKDHIILPSSSQTTGHAPQCKCNAAHRPGIVLDPFIGSGTTAQVAIQNKRDWLGIELNPDYIRLAMERIRQTQPPLFAIEDAQASPVSNELYDLAAERDALKGCLEDIDNRIKELI